MTFQKGGALPPPDAAWQMGKTAASIRFVKDTEEYLNSAPKPHEVVILTEAIAKIKDGSLALSQEVTPRIFIDRRLLVTQKLLKP